MIAGRRSQTEIIGTIVLITLVLGSIAAVYTWGMPLIAKSGDANRIEYVKGVFERLANEFARVAREGGQASMGIQVDKGDFRIELDQTDSYVLTYSLTTEMKFFSPNEVPIDDSVSPYVQKDAWLATVQNETLEPTAVNCIFINPTCDKNGTFTSATDLPPQIAGKEGCLCDNNSTRLISSYDEFGHPDIFETLSAILPGPVAGTDYKFDKADYANGYARLVSQQVETGTGLLGKDKPGAVLAQSESFGQAYRTRLKLKSRNIFDPATSEKLVVKVLPAEGTSTATSGTFTITLRNDGAVPSVQNGQKVRTVTISVALR